LGRTGRDSPKGSSFGFVRPAEALGFALDRGPLLSDAGMRGEMAGEACDVVGTVAGVGSTSAVSGGSVGTADGGKLSIVAVGAGARTVAVEVDSMVRSSDRYLATISTKRLNESAPPTMAHRRRVVMEGRKTPGDVVVATTGTVLPTRGERRPKGASRLVSAPAGTELA
jgi:hypothetical protein